MDRHKYPHTQFLLVFMARISVFSIGILSFFLIVSPVVAWWDSNWEYEHNITFTETADYPISDYPVAYLMPKANFSQANCSDARVLNSTQDEIPFSVYSRNASHCAFAHSVTLNNLTSVDYQIYYSNVNADYSAYWHNWSAIRKRQDSFEDGDYSQEPTWDKIADTGTIDVGVGCNALGIGNGLEDCSLNFTSSAGSGAGTERLRRFVTVVDDKAFGFWVKWSNPELTHNYNGRINLVTATECRCQISLTNANALDCDVDGSGFKQVWYPINADDWYRLVFEFNYDANTVNISIYAENRTWLNSSTFANTDENLQQLQLGVASTQASEIWSVDLATHDSIVETEPIVTVGAFNFTPTTTTTLPAIVEIDYCRLLWVSQGAQVRTNHDWCIDNQTLARNITFQINVDGNQTNIVSYSEEICRFGCDNRTNNCNPAPVEQYSIWAVVFLAFLVFGLWLVAKLR